MRHSSVHVLFWISSISIIGLGMVICINAHPSSRYAVPINGAPTTTKNSILEQRHRSLIATTTTLTIQPSFSDRSRLNLISSTENSPEQGWKTYVNKAYHYRISVPSLAQFDYSDPRAVRLTFSVPFTKGADTGTTEFSFSILVYENSYGMTVGEWVHSNIRAFDPDSIRLDEPTTINGVAGYRVDTFEIDEMMTHLYVGNGSLIFELSFPDPRSIGELSEEEGTIYINVFERLISSFSLQ